MSFDIIIVFIVLVAAIILFASEKLRVDLVSILIILALTLTGVISPEAAVQGFSNRATVTVAAMFVLSAGLYKTGALNIIANFLSGLFQKNFWSSILIMMAMVGVISAFINNTPVVAILIPTMMSVAAKTNHSVTRLLMPLSFASMFGGVCTLIGTSTNLLVSSIAEDNGMSAIGMFELTPLGIIFFIVGIGYMLIFGIHLSPKRKEESDLRTKFGMGDYLTEVILLPEADSVGKSIRDSSLNKEMDIDIIEIIRKDKKTSSPSDDVILKENDVLRVRADVKRIKELKERVGVELSAEAELESKEIESETMTFVEAVIEPNSDLEGETIISSNFKSKYNAVPLAIRHRGEVMKKKFNNIKLRSGDTILLEVDKESLTNLKKLESGSGKAFLFISELDFPEYKKDKIIPAIITITAVVTLAAFDIVPIMVGAIGGGILMILYGCISMKEAYQSIDWKVIFLLAGALSLGIAMKESGAANLLADFLINFIGALGPVAIVSAIYLITTILTNVMSNNASVVILAPIAISAAASIGVDPRPLLMATTFAGSASFMTPVGYQTNTMIYSAGRYKFADFIKVGGPLNLIFWLLATLLIPVFFPF